MVTEFWTKVLRWTVVLPGLLAGILTGLLVTLSLDRQPSALSTSKPGLSPTGIASMSAGELETFAFDVLTELYKRRGPVAPDGPMAIGDSWSQLGNKFRQAHLGMQNVRRLLPLAKKLTLESLQDGLNTTRMLREKHLVAAVHRVVLDPRLSSTAEVWENDLTVVHVGPDYAAYLTSDDEAMLLLGHELTHVAARTGRLNHFIENVSENARSAASLELGESQKEELACDFIGAEVLKRYITLHPTAEANVQRFSRAFGYTPPSERIARAWQDFCASYNGAPADEEHLSQDQTLRALLGLDPGLKALVPDDAISAWLCR